MLENHIIVREPVIDAKQKVLGFELSLQGADGSAPRLEHYVELAEFLASQLNRQETGWLLGDCKVYLDTSPLVIASEALLGLPPKSMALAVQAEDFADADMAAGLATARSEGSAVIARCPGVEAITTALLAHVTHVEVPYDAARQPVLMQAAAKLKSASIGLVARGVQSWADFDFCAMHGIDALIGKLHAVTKPGSHPKGLNPAQAMILQLMDMVRKNADVRQLEGVLKRDAGLSYKLLRYINSAGFGLGAEIQSLKHAVTMLGYSPLYRWLSVLLASASGGGYTPILMQTAVVRGRFAELLGKGFVPKGEADNLFVAGMFSLLDRLLGIPMEQVLEKIQLPEPVCQALLAREGMYGPFLALAEACEYGGTDKIGELAESMFINATQVNEAHLASLAWAQNLKL
ncbi:MAG TPA: HDOD domain-containing protein [Burkholderiaceae bacterium]